MLNDTEFALIRNGNAYRWLPTSEGEDSKPVVQIDGQWFVAETVPGFLRFEKCAFARLGPQIKN